MTQAEQVLKHIQMHGGISSVEAIRTYGITRLAAVVHRINKANQTNAMKATYPDWLAPGHAYYVPDIDARRSAVFIETMTELNELVAFAEQDPFDVPRVKPLLGRSWREVIDVFIKSSSKLALLKSKETVLHAKGNAL